MEIMKILNFGAIGIKVVIYENVQVCFEWRLAVVMAITFLSDWLLGLKLKSTDWRFSH